MMTVIYAVVNMEQVAVGSSRIAMESLLLLVPIQVLMEHDIMLLMDLSIFLLRITNIVALSDMMLDIQKVFMHRHIGLSGRLGIKIGKKTGYTWKVVS